MPTDIAPSSFLDERRVLILKWGASVLQILGYGATGLGLVPWNLYFFLIGLLGWLAVGVLWRDKALILIHLVALFAMVAGMVNG